MSLKTYLEAAHRDGQAPFDPSLVVRKIIKSFSDPSIFLCLVIFLKFYFSSETNMRIQVFWVFFFSFTGQL